MQCPKCFSKTIVLKTIHKRDFTVRYRKCVKCNFKFTTKEDISSNWNYKAIVREIKKLLENIEVD